MQLLYLETVGSGSDEGGESVSHPVLTFSIHPRNPIHRRFGFGKRSTEDVNDWEELGGILEKVTELFHRASQLDDEQCVQRLICEVNSDSVMYDSVSA